MIFHQSDQVTPRGRESYQSQRLNLFVWHVTISSGNLCHQLLPSSRQCTMGHLCSSAGIQRAREGTLEAAPSETVPALFCRNAMLLAWDIPTTTPKIKGKQNHFWNSRNRSLSCAGYSNTAQHVLYAATARHSSSPRYARWCQHTNWEAIVILVFCTSALEINQHLMDTAFITV